jgi:large subunit ribosomal protein L10
MVENTLYDAKGIRAIAGIPPRNELLSRLLGSLKSPMSSFARVVNELYKKQGGSAEPPAEAAGE